MVSRKYQTDLKDRKDARDHLEHFEERLPGEKNQSTLGDPNDLLNMANQYLTYGGRRIDIGPDSIRLLKTIRDECLHRSEAVGRGWCARHAAGAAVERWPAH